MLLARRYRTLEFEKLWEGKTFSFPEELDQQQAIVPMPTEASRLQVRDNESEHTVKILLENAITAITANGGNTYKLWSEGRDCAKTLIPVDIGVAQSGAGTGLFHHVDNCYPKT